MSSIYGVRVKRPLDLLTAIILSIVTAPIHLACALAIRVTSGSPVYFHQERAGLGGRPFRIHKFRTMKNGTEQLSGNYPTQDMVTPVGHWLRRTSLDELPQLANVVKGEMSFVGPRPALLSQVARYTTQQRERLMVRPGITGLAQILHRNSAPWSVRIETDRRYVDEQSFIGDLMIALRTIPAALRAEGQIVGQSATEVDDLGSSADHSVSS